MNYYTPAWKLLKKVGVWGVKASFDKVFNLFYNFNIPKVQG